MSDITSLQTKALTDAERAAISATEALTAARKLLAVAREANR